MPQPSAQLTPERSARHLFGAKLRWFRQSKGWSLEALASRVRVSRAHLARIEKAEYMPPPELPAELDQLFNADGIFTQLYALCKREAHPDQFRRRMELEALATIIREYTSQIVPGLLQTEAYARALFRTNTPKAADERIDELWALRLGRQALLSGSPPPDYSVILDEAVLLRAYGGPAVMREQLGKLLELSLTPTSFIQVLPFSHGGHALAGGSLSLLTLDSGQQVAYEESISSGTLLEERAEVTEKVRAYDLLSASALSPVESAALIRAAMEALPDEHHP
ncbi:helix-turn-helix domain-containing protein [Streptomyces sp. LE64]|uniref:helix-turn-helix domain-containing protein n=1 Tax=Streptomyces sp. LE64 TaxID=3448653 RepID=UPI00404342FB